jgi:ABC-type multidrug transport system permease subunit
MAIRDDILEPAMTETRVSLRKLASKRAARGAIVAGLVNAIALVLRALLPTYTAVPSTWVMVLVALLAAGIAYLMSYTVVLKTACPAGERTASA